MREGEVPDSNSNDVFFLNKAGCLNVKYIHVYVYTCIYIHTYIYVFSGAYDNLYNCIKIMIVLLIINSKNAEYLNNLLRSDA